MKHQAWTEADADALAEFIYNTPAGQRFLAILKDRIYVRSQLRVEKIGVTGEAAATVASIELGMFKGSQDMLEHIATLADFRQAANAEHKDEEDESDSLIKSLLLKPDSA